MNALRFSIEAGERANNWLDCDVIADAIKQLKKDEGYQIDEMYNARDMKIILGDLYYLYEALRYQNAKTAEKIQGYIEDFEADISLLERTKSGDSALTDDWAKQAESGKVMRIM